MNELILRIGQTKIYPECLTGNEIRLVELHPSSDPVAPISCSLHRFLLDDVPPFEALSYCWGDPQLKKLTIICNEQSTAVTSSLHSALGRLRLLDQPRTVWIDALCINQHCFKEKSHQIPLMRSIYSLAGRVIAWLGDAPLEEARRTASLVRDLALQNDALSGEERVAWMLGYLAEKGPMPLVEKLCLNPYFKRLWCIQEVHLAKLVVAYYGAEEISWRDVQVPALIHYMGERFSLHTTGRIFQRKYDDAMLMMNFHEDGDVLAIITRYSRFLARDPRDKVYGLLGIIPASSSSSVLNSQLDYTDSVANIYANTIIRVVRDTQSLEFLDRTIHLPEYNGGDGFKSWVIRWDRYQGIEWFESRADVDYFYRGEEFRNSLKRFKFFNGNLSIQGLVVSNIADITTILGGTGSVSAETIPSSPEANSLRLLWSEVILRASRTRKHIISALTTMAFTLTAGRYTSKEGSHQRNNPTIEEKERHLHSFLSFMTSCYGSDIHPTVLRHYNNTTEWRSFSQLFSYSTRSPVRRAFWTENGLLGLGPACLREHDIVVMFYGSPLPHILRPQKKEEEYLYLGVAWIENLTPAKVEEYLSSGVFEEAEFCLI